MLLPFCIIIWDRLHAALPPQRRLKMHACFFLNHGKPYFSACLKAGPKRAAERVMIDYSLLDMLPALLLVHAETIELSHMKPAISSYLYQFVSTK